MDIVFVVAIAENGTIGLNNTIPWRLKSDMQRFKRLTMGKPVVMGRKTFQSFPKPLPGRTNIVMTRDAGFSAPGALAVTSLAQAMDVARGDALRRFATEIAVIGGTEIYVQWMPLATRLEITEVHKAVAGDATFTPDLSQFEEVSRVFNAAGPDDNADFSYVTWRRKPLI
ncbi:diacylglycerol kinase [Afipia sp. P52-10]|jgi:dihydrofolate reductase|uniref:dihydrofolate reductase n=1 Tax=Afipia sp. P52-10 TaxID=1429916 RepID=UPI0003DF0FB1|nr:dihydrofolate reductase [Afipia sp. P52-10]ETR79198.1 diacylglycerol kinase [Afipia sp. P52-10]